MKMEHTKKVVNSNETLAQLIGAAEKEAAQCCGLSDVLYEARVQAAYASILANSLDCAREATKATLVARGFDPNFEPYEAREGECDLTGIETDCCPCGRHE